jgi:nucleoside-diphosphate-sugar epimerase
MHAGPILITGGTGFIGSHVARVLLDAGHEVSLLDVRGLSAEARFVLGEHARDVHVELASIEDGPRIIDVVQRKQPRAIIHLGGIVDPVFLLRNPTMVMRINVEGTLNILEAARICGVDRVVNFSSIGVLPSVRYQPIDVNHPVLTAREGPASGAYGAGKVAGEAFCTAYHKAFGLDVRTIRPSAVYGFGMQPHSANYIKQFVEPAVRGEKVRLPSGGAIPRDYTHVKDVATLAAAILSAPADADRIFYAATGEALVTAAEVARLVTELIPDADLQIAEALSSDDRLEMGFRGVLSIDNARQQLGWSPSFSSLRTGVADYIETYRAFLALGK